MVCQHDTSPPSPGPADATEAPSSGSAAAASPPPPRPSVVPGGSALLPRMQQTCSAQALESGMCLSVDWSVLEPGRLAVSGSAGTLAVLQVRRRARAVHVTWRHGHRHMASLRSSHGITAIIACNLGQ